MALQRMSQIFHARSDFDGDFPAVAGNVFLISDVSARGTHGFHDFVKRVQRLRPRPRILDADFLCPSTMAQSWGAYDRHTAYVCYAYVLKEYGHVWLVFLVSDLVQ